MKKVLFIVFLFIIPMTLFGAVLSGGYNEYQFALKQEVPYVYEGKIANVRSYDVRMKKAFTYSAGIQAVSFEVYGNKYENINDRIGVLNSFSPVMFTFILKQRAYIEWVGDPEGGIKKIYKYSQALYSMALGVTLQYEGVSENIVAGFTAIPFMFSSEILTIGIGVQVFADNNALEGIRVAFVIPISYTKRNDDINI